MSERDGREDSHGRYREEREYTFDPFKMQLDLQELKLAADARNDRLKRLEYVVYGFCTLVLVAVVAAWIKLTHF